MNIRVNISIFQEDDVYVALARELSVSSFGETPDEAQVSIYEALTAFIEECTRMGTLESVLEEAGFVKAKNDYVPRQPVIESVLALAA